MSDTESNDLPTIAEDLVVTKYKLSAEIVNSKYSILFHGYTTDIPEKYYFKSLRNCKRRNKGNFTLKSN